MWGCLYILLCLGQHLIGVLDYGFLHLSLLFVYRQVWLWRLIWSFYLLEDILFPFIISSLHFLLVRVLHLLLVFLLVINWLLWDSLRSVWFAMSMMSIPRFRWNLRRLTDDRGLEFSSFLSFPQDAFHIPGGAGDPTSEDDDSDNDGGDDAEYRVWVLPVAFFVHHFIKGVLVFAFLFLYFLNFLFGLSMFV